MAELLAFYQHRTITTTEHLAKFPSNVGTQKDLRRYADTGRAMQELHALLVRLEALLPIANDQAHIDCGDASTTLAKLGFSTCEHCDRMGFDVDERSGPGYKPMLCEACWTSALERQAGMA